MISLQPDTVLEGFKIEENFTRNTYRVSKNDKNYILKITSVEKDNNELQRICENLIPFIIIKMVKFSHIINPK